MSTFLLPLVNIPQKFEISLAGVNYVLTSKWNNSDEGGWTLDIADATTGDPIVCGIPLITGADCLEGLSYLGINGSLVVYTDGDELAPPTYENLGVEGNLYFLTDANTT